ncbi:bifunctional glycosyltransferase family 2/GtrA family protein [Microbacterium sp. T2.11-28]|uniref:bifunctional glycosyltransferase family 2/GtrA family protein n=1 Tax=Microbacterium sp. T2.11-28 TaxID=3041169 RepID=UPI0024775B47|nr:bifunctional glycosyltransferase family 2/GtrA family protein [Microbacterium sp. T2.11-28]CAI9390444.1 hypothetical protein MICABA_01461 [Microbacterium sp. T2.11-28]
MTGVHVILIPAFEPDGRLVELVRVLRDGPERAPVLIVDDGSGAFYRDVFAAAETAGAVVVAHPRNRGKGAALRTGFAEIARRWPAAPVVTADADGQHTPEDIRRVAVALRRASGATPTIVLGARSFTGAGGGAVPMRSRVGNVITRGLFRLATGQRLTDTQTGLRGYPPPVLPWLQRLRGDRFEYEFAMLLRARETGIALAEVPIATVYLEGNASSHFRPLSDSVRVSAPLLRFTASALLAFAVDTLALLLLHTLTGWLLFSVVAARVISASLNFAVNRSLVFGAARTVPLRTAAARYFSLAGLLLTASYGLLTALSDLGLPLPAAKLVTDATLFVVSFAVQRAVVFAPARSPAERSPAPMPVWE